jgi:hypothetical protein
MWALVSTAASGPDWTWLTSAGSIGILAAVVVGFWQGWIVPGSELKAERLRCKEEREQLRLERDRAVEQVSWVVEIARRTLEAAERKAVP